MTVADFTKTIAVIAPTPDGKYTTPSAVSYEEHLQTVHDQAVYRVEGSGTNPGDYINTTIYTGQQIYWPGHNSMPGWYLYVGSDPHTSVGTASNGKAFWSAGLPTTWTPPANLAPGTYRLYATQGDTNVLTGVKTTSTLRVIVAGPPPTPIIREVRYMDSLVWPTRSLPPMESFPPINNPYEDGTVIVTWDDGSTRDFRIEINYHDGYNLTQTVFHRLKGTTGVTKQLTGFFTYNVDAKVRVVTATNTSEWFTIDPTQVLNIHVDWDAITSDGHFVSGHQYVVAAGAAPYAAWFPDTPDGQRPVLMYMDYHKRIMIDRIDQSIINQVMDWKPDGSGQYAASGEMHQYRGMPYNLADGRLGFLFTCEYSFLPEGWANICKTGSPAPEQAAENHGLYGEWDGTTFNPLGSW